MSAASQNKTFVVAWHVALVALLSLALARRAGAQTPDWIASLGSSKSEGTHGVMSDGSGGVVACGYTEGALFFSNPLNETKAWIARLDSAGAVVWSTQLGSTGIESHASAVVTNSSGGFFVVGTTPDALGGPSNGTHDVWAASYDLQGTLHWLEQFNFPDGSESEVVACETGTGELLVTGHTDSSLGSTWAGESDVFTFRIDAAGNLVGLSQIGSASHERPSDIATDRAGGAYLCGETGGSLGGPHQGFMDGWLARCAPDGTFLWTVQIGSSAWDTCGGVVSDESGGVFVSGWTAGDLGGPATGTPAPFVARHDGAGNQLWIRRYDEIPALGFASASLCGDGKGGAYLQTATMTSIVGPHQGQNDVAWAHIGPDGVLDWMAQIGTQGEDLSRCIAEDGNGGFIAGGSTWSAALSGTWQGMREAFVLHFDGSFIGLESYCAASTSSIPGCQASIGGSGPISLFDPQLFEIHSGAIPGANLGLCIFGANGAANIPFGTQGGLLCIQPPFFRSAPTTSGGTSGQCDGELVFGLDGLIASSNIVVPGADLRAQIWARDPASADGFILSDALHFYVSP